jgi:hypothetical protein
MRKIAIALILFQLMGCAKQPGVITHPEKKQEHETPQHDTPQAPKTNYLKIGASIGGAVIAILASIGLIAYCRTRKEKALQAKKIAEQDAKDIDRIVLACAQEIQDNYPGMEDGLRALCTNHLKYEGKMELRAILKWHFLQPLPKDLVLKPGETYLSRQREYVEMKVNDEVRRTRQRFSNTPMTGVFVIIEKNSTCFLKGVKNFLILDQRILRASGENLEFTTASNLMNGIARLVYYHEFKNALIENE